MASFYVGQRVRILWSQAWPELAGQEGTVVGVAGQESVVPGYVCEWQVAPDSWGDCVAPASSHTIGRFAPQSSQLEPLTDANDLVAWEDCLWQPEHLREAA